ncbi:SCP-like protein [Dictyocaulus viviparus]|uniref:SCP-like protein n=1 Tax=Dictyocaulus viviparus TaxID=29172 RepID=A0A0D8XYF3_DICVI|nr:SCP-like protein [Dictyocaulus viviparus]
MFYKVTSSFIYYAILHLCYSAGSYEKPFGCKITSIKDQARQNALDEINTIRSEVALGHFHGSHYLPTAKRMNKLKWDCALEKIAVEAVKNCPRYHSQATSKNGINYHRFQYSVSLSDPIVKAIEVWSDVADVLWPYNNIYNGDTQLLEFANLVFGTTTAVGCSTAKCGNRISAACVFSKPQVKTGTLVYTPGTPCEDDDKCGTSSYCEHGLCVDETKSTEAPPTKNECETKDFNVDFRDTALGMHNNFRSRVARGRARNGFGTYENAPPSSRMDLMVYDCEAEQFAISRVKLCTKKPPALLHWSEYSENFHVLGTTATDILGALQNAISTWTKELEINGIPSNMLYTNELGKRKDKVVTNVTKVSEFH